MFCFNYINIYGGLLFSLIYQGYFTDTDCPNASEINLNNFDWYETT